MRKWPDAAEVRVLSVVEFVLSPSQTFLEPPFIGSEPIQNIREDAMKLAQEAVASAVTLLENKFANISESISVLLDRPHALILKEAQDWNADLIVLGSHGRHGADRFLLGSVSEAVATHAHCSVEVIR
jgi:nucleotide-binding universal stress UspA family protein